MTYEGYGPGGVAVMLRTLTDNRNRTVGEIRHAFTKHGGNLGEAGCVAYLFEKRGVIALDGDFDLEQLYELALEAGAEDVIEGEGGVEVVTEPDAFEPVRDAISGGGLALADAEVTMRPSTTVSVQGSEAEGMIGSPKRSKTSTTCRRSMRTSTFPRTRWRDLRARRLLLRSPLEL